MGDIYSEIWANDDQKFTVAARLESGEWSNPNADLKIDDQVKADGRRNQDFATSPLIQGLNESKLDHPEYRQFIDLLDNYVVDFRAPEEETPVERAEIDAFLANLVQTRPMQVALDYVEKSLGHRPQGGNWLEELYRLWFQPFTNHYNGKSTAFCSGFEHVFVGEGKYDVHSNGPRKGEVSGYHNWLKFYFDERFGRVNFLGYKYDVRGSQKPSTPNIITLQMIWNHQDLHGTIIAELFKQVGGFFVGSSPGCEFAMGTAAFFDSVYGRLTGEESIRTEIDGDVYDLIIYRSVEADGRRGSHIRSFYPKFIGVSGATNVIVRPEPNVDRVVVVDWNSAGTREVMIVAAMVDPEGTDETGEWVKIKNTDSGTINLGDYVLMDKSRRRKTLAGNIEPGAEVIVSLDRTNGNGMMLSNSSGEIILMRDTSVVHRVSYGRPQSGVPFVFTS